MTTLSDVLAVLLPSFVASIGAGYVGALARNHRRH